MEYSKLDVGEDNQDNMIITMLCDTQFLAQCIRKKIKPSYFSGSVRNKVVDLAYTFYERYDKAPSENIADEILDCMTRGLIKKADSDMYEKYLSKIFDISDSGINRKYLLDRVDLFIKRRLALTTTNRLNKLKTRLDANPDKLLDIMRETILELDTSVGTSTIEMFSEDPLTEVKSDTIVRFGIPAIDRVLGGGLQAPNFGIILGYTGRGKTWCVAHLAKMAVRYGESVLVICNEASNKLFRRRLHMSMTGMTREEMDNDSAKTKSQTRKSMIKRSEIFLISEEEKGSHVDDLPATLDEIEEKTGKKIRLILIDSADDMLPPKFSELQRATGIEKSTAKYTWLKNYSKDNDICILTTCQSQRRGETKWWLTSGTIGDDINKVRKATFGISVNGLDSEVKLGLARLLVFKYTDGPTGQACWVANDFERGQFCVDSGQYNRSEYKELMAEMEKR